MNFHISAKTVSELKFYVKKCNEGAKEARCFDLYEAVLDESNDFDSKALDLKNSTDLTEQDQFGLSLKVTFTDIKGDYFLKLPPDPQSNDASLLTHDTIQAHYDKMEERFKNEFEKWRIFNEIHERCDGENFSVARPLCFCKTQKAGFDGKQVKIPAIIYEYIPGDDLAKSSFLSPRDKRPRTAREFLKFAEALARAVQRIHNQGLLHSFLVPRNIIQKGKNKNEFVIAGFGYSSFCDSKYQTPELSVSDTDKYYRAPECEEKENLGALWFPADIYSIGAILFRYATGETPNTAEAPLPRDVNRLKVFIYQKFSEENQKGRRIFLENENILKILDKCLRYNPENRFSCAEELLEALAIAKRASGLTTSFSDKHGKTSAAVIFKAYGSEADVNPTNNRPVDTYPALKSKLSPLFIRLLRDRVERTLEDARRMGRGHYEIFGGRDELLNSLCWLLAVAKKGDVYRTMTLTSYWTDNNLGSNGRFLTMNKHMARKGLNIERLFMVDRPFHELTEQEQEILEHQLQAELSLKNLSPESEKIAPPGSFRVKVKQISGYKLTGFETEGSLVAYLHSTESKNNRTSDRKDKNPNDYLCLNFVSQGRLKWLNGRKMIERSIKKIRYWIPKKGFRWDTFGKNKSDFDDKWENAISLAEYIGNKTENLKLDELLASGKKYNESFSPHDA